MKKATQQPVKHTIKLKGFKPFEIWNDKGKVRQSGWFELPEVLQDFGSHEAGLIECGAYICGMATLSKILDGRYCDVKPQMAYGKGEADKLPTVKK